jgi:hypothetical protein
MPINVDLGTQSPFTIDQNNVQDGNVDLALAANGTLIVDGVNVSIVNIAGGSIVSNTTIESINGANVNIGNNVAGVSAGSTFTYDIAANSSLTLNVGTLNVGLLNSTTINFQDTLGTGEFTLFPSAINLSLSNLPVVNGLSNGDKIEVIGATSASLVGNVLTFHYPGLLGLDTTAQFFLSGIPVGSSITFDAATGTVIFACFLRGTRVATPAGEVAVEDLRPGDEILTLNQGRTIIKWIGRRVLDPKTIERPRDALPVRVRQHALAENVPHRDLLMSPDHSLFLDGSLIPVKLLINGTTIVQEGQDEPFEYFHIELEKHDVIMVEGAFAETYLDLGNRQMFGGPGVVQLFPSGKHDWRDYSYPPVYDGPVFDRVCARLEAQALAMGYTTRSALAS